MNVRAPIHPTDALASRYGAEAPDAILWNDAIALLLAHRSVRAFTSAPLPPGTVETLAAAAQSAATSSNQQAFSIVAVTDPALKARLAALAGNQQHILDAPLLLLWIADLARSADILDRAGASAEGLDYLESFAVAAIDASLAAQNAAVAAESLGLGTVFIGGIRNHPGDVARLVGLPPRAMALFGLVVGVPDDNRPSTVKPRLSQSAIVHHNRYDDEAQDSAIEAYDRISAGFQQSQALPPTGWTAQIIQRSGVARMNGRQKLRDALEERGFPLR